MRISQDSVPAVEALIRANPEAALGLLAAGALLMAALPVALVHFLITNPHPGDRLLSIRPRAWVRGLTDWLFPILVATLAAIGFRLGLLLTADSGGSSLAIALALAFLLGIPVAGVAWALRALFRAGIHATEGGLFLQGSFVRWGEVTRITRTPSALVLHTPGSALFRRRALSSLGWEIDEAAGGELERLWERYGGVP